MGKSKEKESILLRNFNEMVLSLKQKVYLKQQIQFNGIKVKRKSLYY